MLVSTKLNRVTSSRHMEDRTKTQKIKEMNAVKKTNKGVNFISTTLFTDKICFTIKVA